MTENKQTWLRGDLPTWIATGLLAIVCFGLLEFYRDITGRLKEDRKDIETVVQSIAYRDTKLALLEEQAKINKEIIMELKQGQKEIVSELRNLNRKP